MMRTVLVADIGKSTTRVAMCRDGVMSDAAIGPGIDGLAAEGGVADAAKRIADLQRQLGDEAAHAVAIGVAGAISAPDAAGELATWAAARWSAPACVTSDVVTAHLGALGGEAGTILVVGTGAVAFGVRTDGTTRLVDGLGPELGDHGSGYWIGRAGMRAALRARDQPNAATDLTALWGQLTSHRDAVSWLADHTSPVAAIARFAPLVLDAADGGDRVASCIVNDAIEALVTTVCAASEPGSVVALLGGLTQHAGFHAALDTALRAAGRRLQPSLDSAMAGAAHAAARTDLPHERLIHRAG